MRVGVLGRIAAGEETSRYVTVSRDEANQRFRIRTAVDPDMTWERAEYSVVSLDALEAFAADSHWTIDWLEPTDVRTLYRPTGLKELELVEASNWRRWPARLAGQPIFYPVLDEGYARKIARDWNATRADTGYRGFVTRFSVAVAFLSNYEVQTVGASWAREYWIPAEHLERFNDSIVGPIEVIAAYQGKAGTDPIEVAPPVSAK